MNYKLAKDFIIYLNFVSLSIFIFVFSCKSEESTLIFQKYMTRNSSILVPIKFKDRPITYFQLDTGSPRSYIKYCKTELSKVADHSTKKKQVHQINFIGRKLKKAFYLYNTSKKYDCNKIWTKGPIGTIGADFFEANNLVINYIEQSVSMGSDYKKIEKKYNKLFHSVNARVTSNRFIINLKTSNKEILPVMFDTGGGSSDITVEYETWKKLTKKSKLDKSNISYKAWSWKQEVNFITNISSQDLYLDKLLLRNSTVTFADSNAENFKFSKYNSNIVGTISNKPFEGKSIIILDFKNEFLRILNTNSTLLK